MSAVKEPESQVRTGGMAAEAGKARAGGARTPASHPSGRPGIATQIPVFPAKLCGTASPLNRCLPRKKGRVGAMEHPLFIVRWWSLGLLAVDFPQTCM